jgi:peptide/nickel transport system permease protein
MWMRYALHFLRQNPLATAGVVIVLAVLILVAIGPYIVPFDPEKASFRDSLQAPSTTHILGTDSAGMDIFSRVIAAVRLDVTIGVTATAISFAIGVPVGIVTGVYGGRRGLRAIGSEAVLRALDIIQSFPVFIFAMALVAMSGTSARNVVAAVAFVNIPIFVRLVRAEVLSTRERPFVEAAVCSGNPEMRIAYWHILPNSLASVLTQASVTIGWAIILTAGLSFVGAGVSTPTPEWGSMIAIGAQDMITGQWWPALFPGLALGITVFGFAVVGDYGRQLLDPTART